MSAALLSSSARNTLIAGRTCQCSPAVGFPGRSSQHLLCRRTRQQWSIRAGEQEPGKTSASLADGSDNSKTPTVIKDSDFAFIAKLVVASCAGAFLIKYGSLLVSLPFEPNAAIALAVVLGTPAAYSLFLLTQKQ